MKITNNAVVNAEYELFVDGDNGELELMEKATRENPLNFIFGVGMMLPKFEQNLRNLESGESFDFSISSEDAYGEYDDEAVIELERQVFEVDGKLDEEMVFEGNVVPLMDSDGNRLQAQVVSVTATHVTVDLNHPLAGLKLNFCGQILESREATAEEIAKMAQMISGEGGGCSGGCDNCGGDCKDGNCEGGCEGGCNK